MPSRTDFFKNHPQLWIRFDNIQRLIYRSSIDSSDSSDANWRYLNLVEEDFSVFGAQPVLNQNPHHSEAFRMSLEVLLDCIPQRYCHLFRVRFCSVKYKSVGEAV